MNKSRVYRIPYWTYTLPITKPVRVRKWSDRSIIGFDTEYDSETGELLSVQLYGDDVNIFYVVKPREKFTYQKLRALLPDSVHRPMLVAFFALADISKIHDIYSARLTESGLGMLFADWKDMTIFDLSVFWSGTKGFSLHQLGKLINHPKLDYNRAAISRADVTVPAFREYAMRDAEICFKGYNWIRESMYRLFQEDIVHYRSAPAISAQIFRRQLQRPVMYPFPRQRGLALHCYWGGRSEVFALGDFTGLFTEIDANSEYPRSAIALGALPDGNDWQYGEPGDEMKFENGFVHLQFEYPQSYDGIYALPVYVNDSLYWPSAGESYCTLSELHTAKKYCPKLKYWVRRLLGYKQGSRLELSDYLKSLLKEKDKANGADRTVYKLLANSIIGKLGQNRRTEPRGDYLSRSHFLGLPAGWVPRRASDVSIQVGSCYWPEAASLILGKARAVLVEAMEKIGRHNVALCSTDSIIYAGKPQEFSIDGVPFTVQGTGDKLRIFREKVYLLLDGEKEVKIAHHALPRGVISDRLVMGTENVDVETKEFVKLSRAMSGERLGTVRKRKKTVTLKSKEKRSR